jgi:hypothetical protein
MQKKLISFMAIAAMCSCGGGTSAANVFMYKYAGSVQCTGGGLSLPEMATQLSNAGVQVISSSCGVDGNPRIAMCGAADGRIGIFELAPSQTQAATNAGFAPLSQLPAASKTTC